MNFEFLHRNFWVKVDKKNEIADMLASKLIFCPKLFETSMNFGNIT